MRVTILGCGAAGGVPMIGNQWGACDPANPKNRRRRAAILVEKDNSTLLVDTGPDVKAQLLDAGVSRLDGILYTHIHADHTHGIDEIRALNHLQRSVIDAYATEADLDQLNRRFGYVFDPPGHFDGKMAFYKPCLEARPFIHGKAFNIAGIEVLPFAQDHGFIVSTGFRFGSIAYSTDVADLSDSAFDVLSGVETWIVGCLQREPHPTHANFAQIMCWIERVGPARAVLTHLSLRLDYTALCKELPKYIVPAYDGMIIEGA